MKRSLESPSSVFRCWTIIDLNPVAAGIAVVPEASPHTSVTTRVEHVNAQGRAKYTQGALRDPGL
jgi:hypothetical protein